MLPVLAPARKHSSDQIEVRDTMPAPSRHHAAYSYAALALLAAVTILTRPKHLMDTDDVSTRRVWFFALLTALSTGIGPLPFCCVSKPGKVMLGCSNAVAAGMMASASVGLLSQGVSTGEGWNSAWRTVTGGVVGWAFILAAKGFLEQHEGAATFQSLSLAQTRKVLLVMVVMTLHSFSEGVGIGVSFSGNGDLGTFISTSLAVHNVPEGLAVRAQLKARTLAHAPRVAAASSAPTRASNLAPSSTPQVPPSFTPRERNHSQPKRCRCAPPGPCAVKACLCAWACACACIYAHACAMTGGAGDDPAGLLGARHGALGHLFVAAAARHGRARLPLRGAL